MRLKIELEIAQANRRTLPLNYQYAFSAWIYKVIHEVDHNFAAFLHGKGFAAGTKAYKFFTFSMLRFNRGDFRILGDRLVIMGDTAWIELSFLVPDAIQHFITGIFRNQHFTIGDKNSNAVFTVKSVEALPLPVFGARMNFTTISPMMISQNVIGSRNAQYLAPANDDFERIFFDNLVRKYVAAAGAGLIECQGYDQQHDYRLEILSEPKKKGITIKADTPMQTKVIGYLFDFRITAPPELIKLGYLAGFGEKNSLGMGCGEALQSS